MADCYVMKSHDAALILFTLKFYALPKSILMK